jgi:PHD/YefM family antitoxin component YafN of YafNO toxin-antitoxin module
VATWKVLFQLWLDYVVDTQGQPFAVLLTLEEYEHYLDLLDDEADSQDAELAARLDEAATRPPGGERRASVNRSNIRVKSGRSRRSRTRSAVRWICRCIISLGIAAASFSIARTTWG